MTQAYCLCLRCVPQALALSLVPHLLLTLTLMFLLLHFSFPVDLIYTAVALWAHAMVFWFVFFLSPLKKEVE